MRTAPENGIGLAENEASEQSATVGGGLVDADCVFPVSFAQQRLWFLDQFRPGDTAYLIPWSLRLTGPLDVGALERSLDEIVRRHEVLRTTFDIEAGEPVQVIRPYSKLRMPVVNLTAFSDPVAEARRLAADEGALPIDLRRGPMVRAHLLRLGAEDHVLLFTMHHIAFDGSSRGVFARELEALYEAYSSGRESPLAEPTLQYADYTVWQREQLSGDKLERQLDYWKATLEGISGNLDLPTDRPRPAVLSAKGGAQFFRIDANLKHDLTLLARRHNATLYMTLLAAFQVLLSRYSGQMDVVVGSPIAGRNRPELEGLIGLFANMIALRSSLQGNPSFTELIGRTRETCLGAFANQDVPFEKLVESLPVDRHSGQNPVFQAVFALQNVPSRVFQLRGVKIEPFRISETAAKFDISLLLTESPEIIQGRIEYHADLFDEPTVGRMVGHYLNLLEGIVRTPDCPVFELPLLSAEEEREQLERSALSCPTSSVSRCIHELFEEQVSRGPDNIAVIFEHERLTYAELNARANQLAHRLRALGADPESLIGICLDRSPDMVVAILAVLKCGGAYLPLDPVYPPERRAFMLEDARVPILITESRLRLGKPVEAHTIILDEDWPSLAQEPVGNLEHSSSPENAAYVIYTSGSTGRPKGVVITHANVVRLFTATDHWFGFGPSDTWTLFHSFAFDFSVWEIWGALLYGGRLVVVPWMTSRSPELFHDLLVDQKVTVLNQTPSAFRNLIAADERSPRSGEIALRYVIFGGEALEFASLLPWVERHGDRPALINMYGITETTVHVTYYKIPTAEIDRDAPSLIGVPIPDLQAYVLDDHLRLVPEGVTGQLFIGGAGLAREYLNRPELTADRFIPNSFDPSGRTRLYKTGDLARYRPGGNLQYLGRCDQQVKIRGFRIELGEIETRLSEHPSVAQCAVVARGQTANDTHLAAYVVLNSGETLTVGEMREFVRKQLPDYMAPASLTCLSALPLTTNGKVDRKRLQQIESRPQANAKNEAAFRAWREEIESLLMTHPDIEEAVAAVREVPGSGWHLFAWVAKKKGSLLAAGDLWNRVAPGRASDTPVPAILIVDRLPRLENGGIDIDSLSAPLQVSVGARSLRIEPRNALECQLVRVWEEVLGVSPVSINDNYFELGGHSITAIRLFHRIEEETGRRLPLSLLFKAPTVAEFATAMREQAVESKSETLLVPCRATGSKPPLFAIHGLGGNILAFWDLARHLGSDRPVYCMETLDPGTSERSLEEVAARYISDIRAFRPEGPYHLTGSSFGGMLIFEMARQLRASGLEVGLVGLLDTYNMVQSARLSTSIKRNRARILRHLNRLPTKHLREWPRYLAGRVVAIGRHVEHVLWRRAYRSYVSLAGRKKTVTGATEPGAVKPSPFQDLWRVYQALGLAYRPSPYKGNVVLFRATDPSRDGNYGPWDLGWTPLTAGGLEIVKIPGDHLSMLHEPNIAALAEEMTRWLSRYEQERCRTTTGGD